MHKATILLLLPWAMAADTHRVAAEKYYRTFSHQHPVLKRILAGDTVITKTVDSGGKDEKGVERSAGGNPLTGPFYIEGVEAGDAIAVRFNKVRLNRNWGTSSNRLGLYSLTPESVEKIFPGKRATWEIDLSALKVRVPYCVPIICAGTAIADNPPPMSNSTSKTRSSRPVCAACRPPWDKRRPSIEDASS
jgi:acetamidase/formamidase